MKKVCVAMLAVASMLTLSSCAMNVPQTRAEFTSHPQINKKTYTVSRSVDAVVVSLNKQAERCVNREYVQTRAGGGGVSTSRDVYLMTVKKISANRAELTYRLGSNNMAFQPQGGFFRLAADIEARSGSATKITLYHGPWSETLINAVTKWSKGDTTSCHGYGGK